MPIRLKRSNTAEDLVSLSHEYGHGIQFRSNFHPDFFKFGNAFVEVISLFFELLSMEYFGKFPEFQESLHAYRIASFDNLATRGDMLLFEMDVLCIWEERDHSKAQRIKAMNEKIKARFGWNEKMDIGILLDMNYLDDLVYIIGYLLAIELLINYMQDKEWGLYLLKELIAIDLRLDSKEYYKKVLELVKPNEHLEEYKRHILLPK